MIGIGFLMCCIAVFAALLKPSENAYSRNTKAAIGFIVIFGLAFICLGVAVWLWGNLP